jgi:hypothetical protein
MANFVLPGTMNWTCVAILNYTRVHVMVVTSELPTVRKLKTNLFAWNVDSNYLGCLYRYGRNPRGHNAVDTVALQEITRHLKESERSTLALPISQRSLELVGQSDFCENQISDHAVIWSVPCPNWMQLSKILFLCVCKYTSEWNTQNPDVILKAQWYYFSTHIISAIIPSSQSTAFAFSPENGFVPIHRSRLEHHWPCVNATVERHVHVLKDVDDPHRVNCWRTSHWKTLASVVVQLQCRALCFQRAGWQLPRAQKM